MIVLAKLASKVNGKHEPYWVSYPKGKHNGSITFNKEAWKEKVDPKEGATVELSDIIEKPSGLSALSARFHRPLEH